MSRLKHNVGNRIKELRTQKGLTQEKLSESAGISVDFLSLIERGRNAPSLSSLEKIAKALSVKISALFTKMD